MHLIDEPSIQILLDGGNASPESNITTAGRFLCAGKRSLDAVGDEVEDRTAVHFERRARVVREDEHRNVIRRVFAPPASPRLIGPWAAYRTDMFRPMIHAPILSSPRAAKSSSIPVVPSSLPNIRWKVRVGYNH